MVLVNQHLHVISDSRLSASLPLYSGDRSRVMTAINCVMLSARGDPIPLPGEKFLYNSTATVSISLFRRPEGADFSVQPRKGHEYKATGGTVYVSQRRIVYVAREAAVAGSSSSAGSGATAAIQLGSLAAGQASLAPDAQILAAPGKVQLATLSVPLRFYVDGHLVQPWLSANYVEALCITDNSADGLVVSRSRGATGRVEVAPSPVCID